MAERLKFIADQIASKASFVDSSFDYLSLGSLLTQEENETRLRVRAFVQKEITPHINSYVEEAKFPEYLLPKFKQQNLSEYFLKPPYGKPFSHVGQGALVAQLYRGDAGVGTFFLVQNVLVMFTIELFASEEQKAYYLPKLKAFDLIAGWALTEQKIGSDASNLETNVVKTPNGYKLNGTKRWHGSGNRNFNIVWARNTENQKVEAYFVDNSLQGVSHHVIKNKLALRIVQNTHINYNNVLVPESCRLPKAVDFNKGTNVVLKHSRIFVCWGAAGVCMGVYDNMIKYITSRKQFGQYIAGFQLVQQKVVKVMATTQAVLLACWRISNLADQNKISIGQIAMTKAWVTDRTREVAKWGREVYGGNGIIHDNYAMKALGDAEALYTYEGTYDINTLVAGREITGISAFKK